MRQLARGSLVSFFIQGTGAGLIFFSEILLARVLGVTQYGLFATVMAWSQVLVLVALVGNNHLLLRFVPTYLGRGEWSLLRGIQRYSSRISMFVALGVLSTAALLLASMSVQFSSEVRSAFLIGLAALPFAALSLQRQAFLRGLHRVAAALAPELILRPLLLMALVVALAFLAHAEMSAAAALALNGVAVFAAFAVGRLLQQRAMPTAARQAAPEERHAERIRIGVPLFLITGIQLLIVRLDIILLGAMAGHEAAGYYAPASRVADLVVFALASANVIVGPLVAGLYARNDVAGLQKVLATLAKGVLLFTIPLVFFITFFGLEILGLFGDEYRAAYVPLLILTCGQVVNAVSGPVDFVMAMTGQQVRMLQILALSAVLNVALNLLLIPPFGLVGAAIATASTTVFWNLLMRRAVMQRLGVDASILVLFWRRRTP